MTLVERDAHYSEMKREETDRRRVSRESGCCANEAEGWGLALRVDQEITCPVCTARLRVVRRFRDPSDATVLRIHIERVGESPLIVSPQLLDGA